MQGENGDRNVGSGRAPVTNTIAGFLGLIPSFTGSEEFLTPAQFIESIEEVSQLAGWTDAEKLLIAKTRIKGGASEFLSNHHDVRQVRAFETFKKYFLEYFEKQLPLAVKLQQFTSCKQKAGESVKQYAGRVKNLAFDYLQGANFEIPEVESIADKTRLSQFLSGLNVKLQRAVLSHNPTTLEKAIEVAILEEANERICSRGSLVNATETCSEGLLEALLAKEQANEALISNLQKKISELEVSRRNQDTEIRERTNRPQERDLGGRVEDRRCFFCARIGHLMRNCTARPPLVDARNTAPRYDQHRGGQERNNQNHRAQRGSQRDRYQYTARNEALNAQGRPGLGGGSRAPAYRR